MRCLRVAILLSTVNEVTTRNEIGRCPICNSKIPFSLALHMQAVHSPDAIRRNAEMLEASLVDQQATGQQTAGSKSQAQGRRNRPGPRRRKGKGKR